MMAALRAKENGPFKGNWDLDQLKIEFEELIIEEAPIEVSGCVLTLGPSHELHRSAGCRVDLAAERIRIKGRERGRF